jgi:dipeptidyl aminopeptidase/acylaminoacyl peptidase
MRLALLLSLVVLGCLPLFAQPERSPLSPEEVLSYRALNENQRFTFSTSGRAIAYTVRRTEEQASSNAEEYEQTGVPYYAVGSSIWLLDSMTGHNEQLFPENADTWAPVWSPDGRQLAYFSSRGSDHKPRIWLYDTVARTTRQVSDLVVHGLYSPKWTPDGKALLVQARSEAESKTHQADTPSGGLDQQRTSRTSVSVYSSKPAVAKTQEGGPWRLNQLGGQLALVSIRDGQVTWLTKNKPVTDFWPSPDGQDVAFTIAEKFSRDGSQQVLFNLFVFQLETGKTRLLAGSVRLSLSGGPVTWAPDSKQLAYIEDGWDGLGEGFVVDVAKADSRKVTSFGTTAPSPYTSGGMLWDAESKWVYFRRQWTLWRARADGGESSRVAEIPNLHLDPISTNGNQIWTQDRGRSLLVMAQNTDTRSCGIIRVEAATGKYEKLLEKNQAMGEGLCLATEMAVSPDGKTLVFQSQDAVHAEEIWIADGSLRDARQLTHINSQFERHDLGSVRLVEWHSVDGERLRGVLMLPPNYRTGQRLPLIVRVYASSSPSSRMNLFGVLTDFVGSGFFQLFTTRGCAVFLPDIPIDVEAPTLDILKSVMPGIERVVQMGIADPDRLGVMGHSFGGYTVLSLLTQTTRFKAAVVSAGYADRLLQYGSMNPDGTAYGIPGEERRDIGLGGTPWQYPSRYLENSPVYHLDRIGTPVLLLHGSEDRAVRSPTADQVFVSLRRLGKTVEYAKYQGEGHSAVTWSHVHQLDYINRILDWFDKYLRVKETTAGNVSSLTPRDVDKAPSRATSDGYQMRTH